MQQPVMAAEQNLLRCQTNPQDGLACQKSAFPLSLLYSAVVLGLLCMFVLLFLSTALLPPTA